MWRTRCRALALRLESGGNGACTRAHGAAALSFTWIPFYEDLAHRLLDWEDRQPELVAFLERLRGAELPATPVSDRDVTGARVPLREIDPFTFLGACNRTLRHEQRLLIVIEMGRLLGTAVPPPSDFDGIPVLNNQRSWFFSYADERKPTDVPALWRTFRLALGQSPLEDPAFAESFDAALAVRGVNINLTMGLFWIRPRVFLNLDSTNRAYLGEDLPRGGLSFQGYRDILTRAASRFASFPDLSLAAWRRSTEEGGAPPAVESAHPSTEPTYWMVGAFWDGSDPPDQTARFRQEGIWENGYTDKYLDEVRSMAVGDRIAIKAAFSQKSGLPFDAGGRTVACMEVKAVGTVVKNRGDGRVVEVEWEDQSPPGRWYFYTSRRTAWRLRRGQQAEEYTRRLIDFAFRGVPQDYEWFRQRSGNEDAVPDPVVPDSPAGDDEPAPHGPTLRPYALEDMVAEGVFVPQEDLARALDRLRSKKNLILQGPPGVGKTFVARRLAYALMQEEDPARVETVQFHPSYAYEDFVRGYRPVSGKAGTFALQDGVFHRFCQRAAKDPDRDYVFIIDEINRGNLAAIFGELLMLLEADKRGPDFGVPLVYQHDKEEERFHVPPRLHVIGMMNLADRSLAMVDFALRRRFSFLTLRPAYRSDNFRDWLTERGMDLALVERIVERMATLNKVISADPLLGDHYEVGHSFFCPKGRDFSGLDRAWFEGIVETEIAPLLEEYWSDNRGRAQEAHRALLAL